nr:hypothetical protein [Tanacetum cinerariifolium]
MEEIVHVTFSKDDEAISQSSTEGDAINFNENISFLDDEFLNQGVKLLSVLATLNPSEFIEADNHPALNEPDQTESTNHLDQLNLKTMSSLNQSVMTNLHQLYHIQLKSSFKPLFLKIDGKEKSTLNLLRSVTQMPP